jgi:RNA polymerase primary sigma factor
MDGNYQNFENLISCGNIGLIRAVDRFDLSQGVRFLTYAANWIALEIRGELSRNSLVIVPIWWQKVLSKITSAYKQMSAEGDEKIPVRALAERANVEVRHVLSLSNKQLHLSGRNLPPPVAEVPFQELTSPKENNLSAEESCVQENARACVLEAIEKLKTPERVVIFNIYGFDSESGPKNLKRVSEIMGNTGERVRQLKEKGIESLRKKLASPTELGGLGITKYSNIL